MPSAVGLLIFTGVARSTKGRVRACRCALPAAGYFLRQISREDFDNLVTFKLRVVKVVCSMLRRVVWASVRIDLKEYYGGLEQQVVELSL